MLPPPGAGFEPAEPGPPLRAQVAALIDRGSESRTRVVEFAREVMRQGLLVTNDFFTDHFPDKVVAVLSELA